MTTNSIELDNKTIKKNVGLNIKTIRKNVGLTQSELAGKSKITQSYLSKIEKGQKEPTISILFDIVETGLNIPLSIFVSFVTQDSIRKKDFPRFYNLLFDNYKVLTDLHLAAIKEKNKRERILNSLNKKDNIQLSEIESFISDDLDKLERKMNSLLSDYSEFEKDIFKKIKK